MNTASDQKTWYTNQLAKVFLYSAGVDHIQEGTSSREDLIIPPNGLNKTRIIVDVEAIDSDSVPSVNEAAEAYGTSPTLMMYINYKDRTGYFEMLGSDSDVQTLSVASLKAELSKN